jgi:uncharacterized membrane protein YhaH (DUF805 family)
MHDYRVHHGRLPLGEIAVISRGSVGEPLIICFALVVLLFPDGRLTRSWRWVLWVYLVLAAALTVGFVAVAAGSVAGQHIEVDLNGAYSGPGSPAGVLGVLAMASAGFVLVPLFWPALGILKYHLYDIDRLISRTLSYTLVTGLLVGLYAGLVLLATEVFGFHSSVAVAAATLAVAALFNPLRRRVQRTVDRRFNRARYDAETTVALFAGRLKDAVDLNSVRDDLAGVVQTALEPVHISVWISPSD